MADKFYVASAATSTEEIWNGIGNPVYPPAKRELAKHGISCEGKRAVQLQRTDYDKYDYLIGMEERNRRNTATRTNGAVAVFLPGVAQRLSDLLDGGFYMVFTSIHEVMIHSEKTADPKDLKRVLADTVRDTTPDEDFLTYYVYHYNRETGRFTYC